MECRLCLSSSPAEALVSIHEDPRHLEHLIWTCCRLRVRQEDRLPDMVCLSCINNLELLDGFRNACFRSATTSRVEIDSYLKIKPEELLLDDLIWENESGADCPPNISSSAENGETRGGKITSNDNMAEIIDTNSHILAEELPLRKALDKMSSTDSELDHIHSGERNSDFMPPIDSASEDTVDVNDTAGGDLTVNSPASTSMPRTRTRPPKRPYSNTALVTDVLKTVQEHFKRLEDRPDPFGQKVGRILQEVTKIQRIIAERIIADPMQTHHNHSRNVPTPTPTCIEF
ncbi:uncharacterized protein LOC143912562 isoform X2 [Arctopsyche grandis]|uniref:uncharacterized protein LOC143912562 isoform X2 n=1 Tax=Arctopsyche grandis TaxID=121162 RepID=UPI00406D7AC4